MTSISAASAQTYQSPLQKLQDELLSEVKSGAIKSSDQDALASALTDIDSAMQASRAGDQANGTRPSAAVATLQALLRRYFAISDRVSRSSSTTRMLGIAWAMPTFCR